MINVEKLIGKASVLTEALPYIQQFAGKLVVVKFGGSAMESAESIERTMRDIVLMKAIGMRPVVVHGGGKAITAKLKELNIESKFINGLRVTDEQTIKVVDDVLHNVTNKSLVSGIFNAGDRGVQISGKQLFRAEQLFTKDAETGAELNIGYVGNVIAVNPSPVLDALQYGMIPVVTPLARDFYGQPYNVNADTAACELAKSLNAEKLVFLSDVPGILRDREDESSLIPLICSKDVPGLIAEGVISGGMLPKIQGCLDALQNGVSNVYMVDGRLHHSLLLEFFTDSGVGTKIING